MRLVSSSSSSSSEEEEASEVEGLERGSREKSSREAGSEGEGEVMMEGEAVVECSALRVGRLGVDLDWRPAGSGRGFGG